MTEVPSFKDVHLNPIVSIPFRVTRWRIPCSAHNVVKLHVPGDADLWRCCLKFPNFLRATRPRISME